MLVQVVQVADRHDPFGGDGLVVSLDAGRDAGHAEFGGGIRTDTGELSETLVGRRWDLSSASTTDSSMSSICLVSASASCGFVMRSADSRLVTVIAQRCYPVI